MKHNSLLYKVDIKELTLMRFVNMKIKKDSVIKLDNARVWRSYFGGRYLDKFHNPEEDREDGHFPEEWIMSVVLANNPGREDIQEEGLSKLIDNEKVSLKKLIDESPKRMLGKNHVEQYGDTMGVLVKLIDSMERLPVQGHPDRVKAKEYLNSEYGKTECWHILGGRNQEENPPYVYIGFKEGITKKKWLEVFEKQDIGEILNCMHRFDVKEGDTILIEAGIPHAIGAGCFLAEIQEPTDYTFRLEKKTSRGFVISDEMCHQGIGFDKMFDCFHYNGFSREETKKRWFIQAKIKEIQPGGKVTSLIDYNHTKYFAMDRLDIKKELSVKGSDQFTGLFILQGQGMIVSNKSQIPIKRGNQLFVPASIGNFIIKNNSETSINILQFFGPELK